jgi:HSP20 family protein
MPSIDVVEDESQFVIKTELPGMDTKDIQIHISGDVLTINGVKKKDNEFKNEQFFCRERYCGIFQRNIHLPAVVYSDHVKATFKEGILNITLPKAEVSNMK